MRLYKATLDGIIKKFKSPSSAKPDGYYFTHSKEKAIAWGKNLYGHDKEFYIHEVEVPATVLAIGSRDGWYGLEGMARANKYFMDNVLNVVKKIKNQPKKFYIDGRLIVDDRAMPEIILKHPHFKEIKKELYKPTKQLPF